MSHVHSADGETVVERRDQPKSLVDVFSGFEASHAVFPSLAGEMVTFTQDTSVARAFTTLCVKRILSAPVISASGQVLGVMSVLHLVSFMLHNIPREELQRTDIGTLTKEHILNRQIREVVDMQAIDTPHIIKEHQLVIEAVKLMIDEKDPSRRVLVVDDNHKLVTVITQSKILEIAMGVLDNMPDIANRTLREKNLHKKGVAVVTEEQVVADAFALMCQKNISAVAVADGERRLLGVISASDIKTLGFDLHYIQLLGKSVKEYLAEEKRSSHLPSEFYTCRPDTVIVEVVKLLVSMRLHCVFVVDEGRRLMGVVSIRDLLKTFLNPFMT